VHIVENPMFNGEVPPRPHVWWIGKPSSFRPFALLKAVPPAVSPAGLEPATPALQKTYPCGSLWFCCCSVAQRIYGLQLLSDSLGIPGNPAHKRGINDGP
jgi:hypothetical protein